MLTCAAMLLALGACVERGDFGRVKSSVWNDALSATGTLSALARGDAVSLDALTDDEEELRGRAWRLLEPAHERAWFDRVLAGFAATRIAPAGLFDEDPSLYHRALLAAWARSPSSLYRRLSEDAAADSRLLGPFASVAQRVLAADAVRLRSLAYVHEVSPGDVAHARARVAENRCLVGWVEWGLGQRMRAYRYALEHLVIGTPQPDAVPVERALAQLGQHRAVLDRLGVPPLVGGTCPGVEEHDVPAGPPPRSGPLVRKG